MLTSAHAGVFDIFSNKSLSQGSRYAFAPSKTDATIVAIDTENDSVVAQIPLPHLPESVVVSEVLDLLVATSPNDSKISIVSLESREMSGTLDIGFHADTALLSPKDRYIAFGSHSGTVAIWDMLLQKQLLRIDDLGSATKLTFAIGGQHLFVVHDETRTISVIALRSQEKVADIHLGGDGGDSDAELSALSRSADGYTGFVSVTSESKLAVVDLVEWRVKRTVSTAKGPIRPMSTADNRYVLVPHRDDKFLLVLSALTYDIAATIPVSVSAAALNTGWLDTVAFVMPVKGKEISVVDLESLKESGLIELPETPDDGFVTSDSKSLYSALDENGGIAVIDARRRQLDTIIQSPISHLQGIVIATSNNVCH